MLATDLLARARGRDFSARETGEYFSAASSALYEIKMFFFFAGEIKMFFPSELGLRIWLEEHVQQSNHFLRS